MKRILTLFTVIAIVVLCGCAHKETTVVYENGKATQVLVKGQHNALTIETVEIEGVEYLIVTDDANNRFAICPKVNGKHAK